MQAKKIWFDLLKLDFTPLFFPVCFLSAISSLSFQVLYTRKSEVGQRREEKILWRAPYPPESAAKGPAPGESSGHHSGTGAGFPQRSGKKVLAPQKTGITLGKSKFCAPGRKLWLSLPDFHTQDLPCLEFPPQVRLAKGIQSRYTLDQSGSF